ncbi:MFS transporter [Micrococcales bacterium 31B]|nr:MFS transporter [Micrococcales bacterium 31B]
MSTPRPAAPPPGPPPSPAVSPARVSDATLPPAARRVVAAASIGQFVEFYDFTLYALMAYYIAPQFFPQESTTAQYLAVFGIFAAGFAMRPLGGLLFGHLGDRYGRRGVLMTIIVMMGVATAGIGAIPTFDTIGLWAPALLLLCRLVQGLSAGGELIGSNTLVAEHVPASRRGLIVGFTTTFVNLPVPVILLFEVLLVALLGEESFVAFGWRIPFWLGGAFALIGLVLRFGVAESPEFRAAAGQGGPRASATLEKTPLLGALRHDRRSIFFVFAVAVLSGLAFYVIATYMVSYLTVVVGLERREALAANAVGMVVLFILQPFGGLLSDIFGRRRLLLVGGLLIVLTTVLGFALASTGDLLWVVVSQVLLAAAFAPYFGTTCAFMVEAFPVARRYSGGVIAFNAAYLVFGGTAPYVSTWLVGAAGNSLSPAWYVTSVAVVVTGTLYFAPRDKIGRATSQLASSAPER